MTAIPGEQAGHAASGTTATPDVKVDEETLKRLVPPYNVILHNDDHNSMDHVVRSLVRCVPALTVERAEEIMFEAHRHGQATVITCPKETAELYRERLESCRLTVTIERA